MNLRLAALFLIASIVDCAAYSHKIEPFSFDTKKFEYPLEYTKTGATVALRKTIKLIPKVENRYGGLWLEPVSLIFIILINLFSQSKQTCLKSCIKLMY